MDDALVSEREYAIFLGAFSISSAPVRGDASMVAHVNNPRLWTFSGRLRLKRNRRAVQKRSPNVKQITSGLVSAQPSPTYRRYLAANSRETVDAVKRNGALMKQILRISEGVDRMPSTLTYAMIALTVSACVSLALLYVLIL